MNNKWHKKESPMQGMTGMWGGVGSNLLGAAAEDKVYIESIMSTVPYRFAQIGDAKTIRNVTTGLDFSQSGERKFVISSVTSTKFVVPSDWNNSNNSIECFGGGGCAGYHPSGSGGGGGGAYSRGNNLTLTPGAEIDMHIAYGVSAEGSYNGQDGQHTWFGHSSFASATVAAKGGLGGESGGTAGTGGQASDGIGDVKYSGGNGASGSDGGHGGGCAGPNGNGGNGTSSGPGAGDNGSGGAGGTNGSTPGSAGSNISTLFGSVGAGGGGYGIQSTNGGTGGRFGGGGGTTNGNVYNVGQGQQGGIIVTYTPANAGSGIDGMTWWKKRSGTGPHEIFDTKRGIGNKLNTNDGDDQDTNNNNITSWTNDGVLVQNDAAADNQDHVLWNFKVNKKFFDIQTWTGNGTAGRQISHDLESTPGCIIIKCTSDENTDWIFYHREMPQSNTNTSISNPQNTYITFEQGFAADDSGKFNDTAPTTTNFTVGSDNLVNGSSRTYVAYIWAHNDNDTSGEEGIFGEDGDNEVIHCGSFLGTGSKKSISLGWEPQWLLIKCATNTGGNSGSEWFLFDNRRGVFTKATLDVYDARISPTETSAEYFGGNYVDFTATGFDVMTDGRVNGNGQRMIYMAIRRADGYVSKPPEAGTEVFAMDTGNSSSIIPTFDSGFPVDFALWRATGSSYSWSTHSRLTGDMRLLADQELDEDDGGVDMTWDSNVGWNKQGHDNTYQSWMWKRGAGFDVVCYDGTSGNQTQNHSLGQVPEMIITKGRTMDDWWGVYHVGLGNNKVVRLNSDDAAYVDAYPWQSTTPTSTVFYLGLNDAINKTGEKYYALLFSSVSGISKVGSYSGSDSTQTITTGFQPRFLIVRRTNTSGSWYVIDTVRGWASGNDPYLRINSNNAQVSNTEFGAPTSTGFTLDGNNYMFNDAGDDYIYYAHA